MKYRLSMQSFIFIGQGNLEIQRYIFDSDDSLCLVVFEGASTSSTWVYGSARMETVSFTTFRLHEENS